ncbi:MAG: hypothetical protein K2P92_02460, partial [Bdellovibrionaceae bacterium]|nr:hypothetical protein [Pseudobdellovibrionaceae bacterium]
LCGFRVGIACISGAQVKLKYQFRYFSQDSVQQETPFSGLNGSVQWGQWAGLYVPGHVRDECQYPLFCGMRVEAETLNGRACTVSYQYHIEKGITGNPASNGVWSLLTRSGGADENCDDSGGCGMHISINCGAGNIPVTPVVPPDRPGDFR